MNRLLIAASVLSLVILGVALALMLTAIDRAPGAPPEPGGDPAPRPEALEFVVVDEAGAAVSAARVVLMQGRNIAARGETDRRGEVRFPVIGGEGAVFVHAAGRAPWARELGLVAGRVEVVLLTGATVSGRIVVDDGPPPERLPLRLHGPGYPRLTTDPEGRFRFWGLTADWSGLLVLPGGYVLADGAGNTGLELDGPVDGLEVRARRHLRLTGRAVDAKGNPAPGARLMFQAKPVGGGGRIGSEQIAGEDGRFRVLVPGARYEEASLSATDSTGLGWAKVALDPARLEADLDVGDVTLGPVFTIPFVVRDAKGRPIAGAVAACGRSHVGPTGADGRGALRASPDFGRMRFAAVGHLSETRPIREVRAGGRLEVTLAPATRLAIDLRTPEGVPVQAVFVRVSAEGWIFSSPNGRFDPLLEKAGATRRSGGKAGAAHSTFCSSADDRGVVLLSGLRPGAKLELEARDLAYGSLLAKRTVTLQPGERRDIDWTIDVPERSFGGRVVDETGAPVNYASVRLTGDGRRGATITSDPDGTFGFAELRSDRFRLKITAAGYAPHVEPEYVLPRPGEEPDFVLGKGHVVQVSVADETGRILDAPVEIEVPGLALDFEWQLAGSVPALFEDLPACRATLRARVAGRDYEITHDTREPEARITVPVHGSVTVAWRFPLSEDATLHRVRLTPATEDGAEVCEELGFRPRRTEWEVNFSLVLPGEYDLFLDAQDDDGSYRRWIAGPRVTVRPAERTEATLRR